MSARLHPRARAMRKLQELRRAGVAIVAPGRPEYEQDKHVLAMYEANERQRDRGPFARIEVGRRAHDSAHYDAIEAELQRQAEASPRLRKFYGEVVAAAAHSTGDRRDLLENLAVGIGAAIDSGAELTDDTEAALRERYGMEAGK